MLLDFLLQLLQIQCSVRAISNSKMMDGMMAFGRWYETLPRVRVYKYDYAGMCVLCIFHPYFCNLRTAYPVQSLTIKLNRNTTLVSNWHNCKMTQVKKIDKIHTSLSSSDYLNTLYTTIVHGKQKWYRRLLGLYYVNWKVRSNTTITQKGQIVMEEEWLPKEGK